MASIIPEIVSVPDKLAKFAWLENVLPEKDKHDPL